MFVSRNEKVVEENYLYCQVKIFLKGDLNISCNSMYTFYTYDKKHFQSQMLFLDCIFKNI